MEERKEGRREERKEGRRDAPSSPASKAFFL